MGLNSLPGTPVFPAGLFTFFLSEEGGIKLLMVTGMGIVPTLIGWMIYVMLSVRMALTRRKLTFFILYSIFCILLAMNVVGCKKTLHAAAGIH